MPPSKTLFNLEQLREKALAVNATQIENLEKFLSETYSSAHQDQVEAEWRARQEARISELFRSLEEIDNEALALFRIETFPSPDTRGEREVRREILRLHEKRNQIIAKAESIVADNNGNVSLTPAQLQTFFGL